jgi:hypothetical protein
VFCGTVAALPEETHRKPYSVQASLRLRFELLTSEIRNLTLFEVPAPCNRSLSEVKSKVKLSLCLTKYHVMKTYLVLN